MKKQDTDKKIDDYILNKMTETELHSFKEQLANEPDLALAVAQRQQVLSALEELVNYSTKKQIHSVHQKEMAHFKKNRLRLMRIRKIAAAAVFLLLAGCIWLLTRTTDTAELYATNYSVYNYEYGHSHTCP